MASEVVPGCFSGLLAPLPPEFQAKVVDCLVRKNPPERALARENLRDTCHAGAEPCRSLVDELAAHGEGVLRSLSLAVGFMSVVRNLYT